jgi:hypothetical protein
VRVYRMRRLSTAVGRLEEGFHLPRVRQPQKSSLLYNSNCARTGEPIGEQRLSLERI